MIKVFTALRSLVPGCQCNVVGNTYEGIEWLDPRAIPSQEEVNAEIQRLEALVPINFCKDKAKYLIAQTDWAALPDVNISNKAEFEEYRAKLRGYILNPVADPVFPPEPQPVWA